MRFIERFKGKDWDKKSAGEKLARISKGVDIVSLVGGIVALGFAPIIATLAIQSSIVTYAGAEIYEQHKKRKKKKK